MAPPACARRAGPVLQRLSASVCASERKSAGSPARVVTVGRRRQRGRRIRSGTGHRLRNRDLRASPVRRRATWRRGRVPVRTRWVCAGRVSRHEHQGTGTGIGRVWGRVRRFGTGYSGPETTNPSRTAREVSPVRTRPRVCEETPRISRCAGPVQTGGADQCFSSDSSSWWCCAASSSRGVTGATRSWKNRRDRAPRIFSLPPIFPSSSGVAGW